MRARVSVHAYVFLCILCTSFDCRHVFATPCICLSVCVLASWVVCPGCACLTACVHLLHQLSVCSWTRVFAFILLALSPIRVDALHSHMQGWVCTCLLAHATTLSVCECYVCAHGCVNGHSGQCSSGAFVHVFLSVVMTVQSGPRPARRWAFLGPFTLVGLACPGARPILRWAVPSLLPCHQSYPSQQATRLPPLLAKFGSLCSAAISGSQSHGGRI